MANKVELLIHAAEQLRNRTDVVFLIYGDGPYREELIEYCEQNNLTNVIFKEKWVDPKYVPYIVSQAYINVMNYHSSAFARYGISSSKMFQYMAAGKPILSNIEINQCPITSNNIGIARDLSTPESYANAILSLVDMSEDNYNSMCVRARISAEQYDYGYLAKKFIDILNILDHGQL